MKILNTRIENNEMIVFYEFYNGEVNTNKFPLFSPTLGLDITNWGTDREQWFKDREVQIQEMIEHQLLEVPVE